MSERIIASYLVETPGNPHQAAEVLAGEQSSGTFVKVPGETAELKEQFAARVEGVEILETMTQPSLPGAKTSEAYTRARLRVSWHPGNFGANLPVLISTIQGNLYELRQFSGLRLETLDLPDAFIAQFKGPAYGAAGTLQLAGAGNGPMIGTIIKPSIGLTPEATAAIVNTLAEAGIDFVKDDELLGSSANSPLRKRVDAVMKVINAHADATGKKIMYAFNISGEVDQMAADHDYIRKAGGTCAMISLNSTGISAAQKIASLGGLSIHGHRNGWGMMTRHPWLGIDFRAWQKLWRLAGIDQLHVNGMDNKFWEDDDSVERSIKALLTPLGHSGQALPVVSSGQWGGQAFETWRRTATTQLLYMAGGGIMAHPMGPGAGVKALRQAWEGAVAGHTLQQTAAVHPEFAASVEKFGKKA